jgi:hypothetical protein
LTALESLCIIKVVLVSELVLEALMKCLDKESAFHASSPRIPLLLLPCRHTVSRAASWECRADAISLIRIA